MVRRLSVFAGAVGVVGALAFVVAAQAADPAATDRTQVQSPVQQIPKADLALKPGTYLSGNPPVICIKPKFPKKPGPRHVKYSKARNKVLEKARALRGKLPPKFKLQLQGIINGIKDLNNPCWPPGKQMMMMGTSASCSKGDDD